MAVANGFPVYLANLIQTGFLQKAMQQSLRPKLMYRAEALRERLDGREMGETVTQTRRGLMVPVVTPQVPGVDVSPSEYTIEQWTATMNRYVGGIDTRLPNSAVAIVNKFLEDATALAEQAGWSLDRLTRNRLFASYCGGDTMVAVAAASGATIVQVAALSGFRFAPQNGRMTPVSATNPLTVTIDPSGTPVTNTVVGVAPVDSLFPDGPGYLTLGTALGGLLAARKQIQAAIRPKIVRPGVSSIDGLTSSSIITYMMLLEGRRTLKQNRVPEFADGTYHMHLDPVHLEHLLNDAAFRQLFQGRPDREEFQKGVLVQQIGISFYDNSDNPSAENVSTPLVSTGSSAFASKEFGAEVLNAAGLRVKRSILLGQRALSEFWLPESDFMAQNQGRGNAGYQGAFQEGTGAFEADLSGIRYVVRPPQDRLMDVISQSWSFTGDWVAPTDVNAPTSPAVFKRAVAFESFGSQ